MPANYNTLPPGYSYASLYYASVAPLYRRNNKHPTGYEGRVHVQPDPLTRIPPPSWHIVWRTGSLRLRVHAMLSAQAEVLRLRLGLVEEAERRHKEAQERHLASAALRPVTDSTGKTIGWMPAAFTMKGKRHSPESKERIRAAAKAKWASGERAPPTWLHDPRLRRIPEPAPEVKRKTPHSAKVIALPLGKSARGE